MSIFQSVGSQNSYSTRGQLQTWHTTFSKLYTCILGHILYHSILQCYIFSCIFLVEYFVKPLCKILRDCLVYIAAILGLFQLWRHQEVKVLLFLEYGTPDLVFKSSVFYEHTDSLLMQIKNEIQRR